MSDVHPLLVARGSRTTTPPLEEALSALNTVLQSAELGMTLTGPTRFGKSAFIDEVEARFAKSKGAVLLRSTMTTGNESPWENRFFRRLLGEEEGEESLLPRQRPKQALLRHVENECDKFGTKVVVFALDEAQNLAIPQLDILKVLSENLLNMGHKPFVLLVGQPELLRLRSWLRENLRQDIVQRFMLRSAVLRGLSGAADFRALLRHTDAAVWPEGSSRTYTSHFAPNAWKRGWRIAQEAEGLWLAFVYHGLALGLSDKPEVGTQFVSQAQLALLRAADALDSAVDPRRPLSPGSPILRGAVEGSGFRESLNLGAKPADNNASAEAKATRRWLRETRYK